MRRHSFFIAALCFLGACASSSSVQTVNFTKERITVRRLEGIATAAEAKQMADKWCTHQGNFRAVLDKKSVTTTRYYGADWRVEAYQCVAIPVAQKAK